MIVSMQNKMLKKSELHAFEKKFDVMQEDSALQVRGEFIRRFPIRNIKHLSLDDYVIGKGTESFCAWVEAKSRTWAVIQGSTAYKFGIYYGKVKPHADKRYRFTKKFGRNKKEAFDSVKLALLSLIRAGKSRDFHAIDNNPLSQMLKAKILSLYFPDIYLNICSSEHIEFIASKLGLPEREYTSEQQHYLINEKLSNNITSKWSNPKFISFLYSKFMRGSKRKSNITFKKPRKKSRRKVNFEEIQANRDRIGRLSEEFALKWEKDRLIGLGYDSLAKRIKDRHDVPSYGYDILSYSSPDTERFIEVKSLGYDRKEKCHRFYLSENEKNISESSEHKSEYYFYLVKYNNGKPVSLMVKHANDIYSSGEIVPCAYIVRLEIN